MFCVEERQRNPPAHRQRQMGASRTELKIRTERMTGFHAPDLEVRKIPPGLKCSTSGQKEGRQYSVEHGWGKINGAGL